MHPLSLNLDKFFVCYNIMVYEMIAKSFLIKRLQRVVNDVIDPTQSRFIPDRQIHINDLLAFEHIKVYVGRDYPLGA